MSQPVLLLCGGNEGKVFFVTSLPNSFLRSTGMQTIQTKPTVRLMPPSPLAEKTWVAEDFLLQKRFALPAPGILLLIACMQPQPIDEVIQDVAQRLSLSPERVERVVQSLLTKELLVATLSEDVRRFNEIARQWQSLGWIEAAEYHLATYNYQFLGADEEGRYLTQQRMIHYNNNEEDTNRIKTYPGASVHIPLPRPDADLLPVAPGDAWSRQVASRKFDAEMLSVIASLAFGKVGTIKTPQLQWNGQPAIHRTSPSGGARHPTEAYVVIIDVPPLQPGWYHIAIDSPQLELLHEGRVEPARLEELFPTSYGRAPFSVAAIVILTSIFERNMWRYREPRTFRTIHMDAGHLAESVQMLAQAIGVRAFIQYWANENAIEEQLGLHYLDEGFLLSIALGQ